MDAILVVNAGSSSIKFQVFGTAAGGELRRLVKGQMDGIGSRPRLRAEAAGKKSLIDPAYPPRKGAGLPPANHVTRTSLPQNQEVDLVAARHPLPHRRP